MHAHTALSHPQLAWHACHMSYQETQQHKEEGSQYDPNDDPSHAPPGQGGGAGGGGAATQRAVCAQHRHRYCGIQIAGANISSQILVCACSRPRMSALWIGPKMSQLRRNSGESHQPLQGTQCM